MKIDLEQEKFLARLDLRVSTMCAVASHIEKVISRGWGMKHEQQKRWDKHIDDIHNELLTNIGKKDEETIKFFDWLEKQLKGESENGKES